MLQGLFSAYLKNTIYNLRVSSYPDVCIAPPPTDLNCDDVPYNDIKAVGDDLHGFGIDSDGIGCES
jgi:hypothetical protein